MVLTAKRRADAVALVVFVTGQGQKWMAEAVQNKVAWDSIPRACQPPFVGEEPKNTDQTTALARHLVMGRRSRGRLTANRGRFVAAIVPRIIVGQLPHLLAIRGGGSELPRQKGQQE